MKWWICLTALVLALTTSAAAADLPAELERAAPEAAEDLTGGDLSGGTGFAQGVGNILDRLADQVGDVVRERTRGAAAVLLVVVLCGVVEGFAQGTGGKGAAFLPMAGALSITLASAGVMAVIGTYGSAVTEASQNIIDEAEIMQIATGSTSVRLTEKGLPLFFRTCPRDDEQGRVASKVIAAKGFKKVAILHDNSSYAKGLAEEAQKGLKDAGVPVVFYDALTPSERDYTAILTKLKAADPDLIFFTGYYPEAGMLLRQKKEMHWDVPMMGGDAANNTDLVKIAGKDAAKGYFFISPPSAHDFDTPEAKDFFSRYKAQYNSLPSSVWSVLAGDAFKVIVAALQAGTDANPEAVAKYLKKDLKEYPGLTGKLGFNEKGDRIGDLYKVYEVDGNGGFVLQK